MAGEYRYGSVSSGRVISDATNGHESMNLLESDSCYGEDIDTGKP